MTKIVQLNALLEQTPGDPFLHYAIALELVKEGEHLKAAERFEHLVKTYPAYTGTYYQLGKLYEQMKDTTKALETYRLGMSHTEGKEPRAFSELQTAYNNLQFGMEDE